MAFLAHWGDQVLMVLEVTVLVLPLMSSWCYGSVAVAIGIIFVVVVVVVMVVVTVIWCV